MERIEIRRGRGRQITLNSKIGFGKYKNRKVKWIIDNDYDYLSWCIDNNIISIDRNCEEYISSTIDSYISEILNRKNNRQTMV